MSNLDFNVLIKRAVALSDEIKSDLAKLSSQNDIAAENVRRKVMLQFILMDTEVLVLKCCRFVDESFAQENACLDNTTLQMLFEQSENTINTLEASFNQFRL